MATLIRTDRNGTKYYQGMITCDRCNGLGLYATGVCNGHLRITHVDNGICHKCGGEGKVLGKWKEYTPEYEAKLEARRQAKREKWEAEHAEEIAREEARRAELEAERKRQEEATRLAQKAEERRIREQKAKSQYIGEVGDKVELDVILEKRAWFEVPSFRGFGTDTMHVYTFRDDQGNALVWKTTGGTDAETGTRIHLKGTIKAHSEYDDEKQTVLTRCRIA